MLPEVYRVQEGIEGERKSTGAERKAKRRKEFSGNGGGDGVLEQRGELAKRIGREWWLRPKFRSRGRSQRSQGAVGKRK